MSTALWASILTMTVTLFVFGWGKAWIVGCEGDDGGEVEGDGCDDWCKDARRWIVGVCRGRRMKEGIRGGLQMLAVGGSSAGCAVVLVKGFNSLL